MRVALLLVLLCGTARAETLHYCLVGRHDAKIEADFKLSFAEGWKTFQTLVKRNDPEPRLVYSTDESKIRIYVYPDQSSSIAAGVNCQGRKPGDEVMMVYYNSLFASYAPERKAKVIAHELCHFYFHLPDQYREGGVIKNDCVMGNFMMYGWFGKFCEDCQAKVDKYYAP
jgi:hypothetical protein